MKHLLFVEDDVQIAQEIVEQIEGMGHVVTWLKTVAQTKAIDFSEFSLIILDWDLPDGEGITIAENVRKKKINTPILMLTAKTDPEYRGLAMSKGVNDFLGKPFYFHELKARIDVLIKSGPLKGALEEISVHDIVINKEQMRVFYQENLVTMTKKEFELLFFFASNPDTVFSRNEILDAVWGEDENPSPRTVDTHILSLRKKTNAAYFETVWSSGYRFNLESLK